MKYMHFDRDRQIRYSPRDSTCTHMLGICKSKPGLAKTNRQTDRQTDRLVIFELLTLPITIANFTYNNTDRQTDSASRLCIDQHSLDVIPLCYRARRRSSALDINVIN